MSRRVVRGGAHDEKPPLGTYAAHTYARRWPQWWPDDVEVSEIDYVRVRRPRSADEGKPHEVCVDFVPRWRAS